VVMRGFYDFLIFFPRFYNVVVMSSFAEVNHKYFPSIMSPLKLVISYYNNVYFSAYSEWQFPFRVLLNKNFYLSKNMFSIHVLVSSIIWKCCPLFYFLWGMNLLLYPKLAVLCSGLKKTLVKSYFANFSGKNFPFMKLFWVLVFSFLIKVILE
jgi:hypothetical protein